MTDKKSFFDNAVYYSDFGWRVFPLRPKDKKPMIKRWQVKATTNFDIINTWWHRWEDANIGIATGSESGIVVIDIDTEKGGDWSLAELVQDYGSIPDAPEVITGSGGKHIYMRSPQEKIRNSAGRLGIGLDIRGNGGYVCAPPSIHPNSNKYIWKILPDKIELPPFPEWMIDLLTINNHASTKQASDVDDPFAPSYWVAKAEISLRRGGGRNEIGFWLACKLRDCGLSMEEAELWMKYYVCRAPRRDHPYTVVEAKRSLLSAYTGKPIDETENDERYDW
jgi:hypothetical protein